MQGQKGDTKLGQCIGCVTGCVGGESFPSHLNLTPVSQQVPAPAARHPQKQPHSSQGKGPDPLIVRSALWDTVLNSATDLSVGEARFHDMVPLFSAFITQPSIDFGDGKTQGLGKAVFRLITNHFSLVWTSATVTEMPAGRTTPRLQRSLFAVIMMA